MPFPSGDGLPLSGSPARPAPRCRAHLARTIDVLLVEDECGLRELLQTFLQRAGYRVSAVGDAASALRVNQTTRVRLTITDVCLPGMDGLEHLQQLQRSGAWTPIIAVAGPDLFDPELFLRIARHFGARRTLVKPFLLGELLAAVRAEIGDPRPAVMSSD